MTNEDNLNECIKIMDDIEMKDENIDRFVSIKKKYSNVERDKMEIDLSSNGSNSDDEYNVKFDVQIKLGIKKVKK